MKSIPLLNVEAAKPPMSPIKPPPKFINNDDLSAPFSDSTFQINSKDFIDLFNSPLLISIVSKFKVLLSLKNVGKQCLLVFSSTKTKRFLLASSAKIFSKIFSRSFEIKIVECFVSIFIIYKR